MVLTIAGSPGLAGIAIAAVAVMFAGSILILPHRQRQPIKFRGPWMLFITGFSCALSGLATVFIYLRRDGTLVLQHDTNCDLGAWIFPFWYLGMRLPFYIRAFRIHYLFNVVPRDMFADPVRGSLSSFSVDTDDFSDSLIRVPTKLQYMEESKLVLIHSILLVLAYLTVTLFTSLGLPPENFIVFDCAHGVSYLNALFWVLVNTIEIAVLVFVLYALRDIRVEFSMRNELTAILLVWIIEWFVSFFVFLPMSNTAIHRSFLDQFHEDFDSAEVGSAFYESSRFFVCLATSCIACLWPIAISYSERHSSLPEWSSADSLQSLHACLHDVMSLNYFRDFIRPNIENLYCWMELQVFKDCRLDDLQQTAERIFQKYVAINSELEVDINQELRDQLASAIAHQQVNRRTFGGLESLVFRQMDTHDFPRFLENCRGLVDELDREEALHSSLVRSGMLHL